MRALTILLILAAIIFNSWHSLTYFLKSNNELIRILCEIFTALGTFGAVVVSLFFSYRSRFPKPKVRVTAKAAIYQNYNPITKRYEDANSYVIIEVFNVSMAPIEINCFMWAIGFFRKKYSYQSPSAFDQTISSRAHQKLNYGEDANYYIGLNEFLSHIEDDFQISECKFLNWLKLKFYYVIVKSNIGICYQSRIDKSLQGEILKFISQNHHRHNN